MGDDKDYNLEHDDEHDNDDNADDDAVDDEDNDYKGGPNELLMMMKMMI